jgi:hypothetical protein
MERKSPGEGGLDLSRFLRAGANIRAPVIGRAPLIVSQFLLLLYK